MRQSNGCSTPAPRSVAAKQWTETTRSNEDEVHRASLSKSSTFGCKFYPNVNIIWKVSSTRSIFQRSQCQARTNHVSSSVNDPAVVMLNKKRLFELIFSVHDQITCALCLSTRKIYDWHGMKARAYSVTRNNLCPSTFTGIHVIRCSTSSLPCLRTKQNPCMVLHSNPAIAKCVPVEPSTQGKTMKFHRVRLQFLLKLC